MAYMFRASGLVMLSNGLGFDWVWDLVVEVNDNTPDTNCNTIHDGNTRVAL